MPDHDFNTVKITWPEGKEMAAKLFQDAFDRGDHVACNLLIKEYGGKVSLHMFANVNVNVPMTGGGDGYTRVE